jgi:hypothetical protein
MKYEFFKLENTKLSGYLSVEKYFESKYKKDHLDIIEYSKEFKDECFKEKLYRYFKKDLEDKKCVCGNKRKLLSIEKGYQEFCSVKCSNKNSVERVKKAKEKKYGDPNYNNKEAFKKTVRNRSSEVVEKANEKRRSTKLKIYGDPNFTNPKKAAETRKSSNLGKNQGRVDEYGIQIIRCNQEDRSYTIKCHKCGEENLVLNSRFNVRLRKGQDPCIKCNDLALGVSCEENDIANYISSLGFEVVRGDRKKLKGFEIDILIPKLSIGFEYNGLYWHSEIRTGKNYHVEKQDRAREAGISLIHIWEDDWSAKKEIVKSRIDHVLGRSKNRIYARKCEILEVDYKETKRFLEENHIQGFCPAQKSIGLYYSGELVSIGTFGVRKISGSSGNELLRFCNKIGFSVVGGFSKIFSHYVQKFSPEEVITFADRSWTPLSDNFYSRNGFEFIGPTVPNYWYIIDKKRKNRFSFRKSELVKQGFDPELSEREIMSSRGILRIYDCGQYKYLWKKDI